MYKSGDLKVVHPEQQFYDARTDDYDTVGPGTVYLPHSCDYWIIGGEQQVRELIMDLTAILPPEKEKHG